MPVGEGFGQRVQNERSGGAEILRSVLLKNRQRLARFAPRHHGHTARREHPAPRLGGRVDPSGASQADGETAQRLGPQTRIGHTRAVLRGALIAGLGFRLTGQPLVQTTEAEALVARVGGTGPAHHERGGPRAHEQRREQIEPVVFEHRLERLGPAVAGELEEPRRNLEAGHVAHPVHARQALLQHAERAARLVGIRPEHLGAIAPEAARGMQRVEMRQVAPRPGQPIEAEAHLEQRQVEGAAVERDEVRAVAHPLGHRGQLRAFVLEARRQELAHEHAVAVDARATHEKRLRAGAARQPRGLEVDHAEAIDFSGPEQGQRRAFARARGGPGPAQHRQALDRLAQRVDHVAHAMAPVARIGRVVAIDDDAQAFGALHHFAAERVRRLTRARAAIWRRGMRRVAGRG